MQRRTTIGALIVCFLLASIAVLAQGDKTAKTKVKGIIISRSGDSMVVKTREEGPKTIFLSDDTKTKDDRGLFGLDKEYMSDAVLIPGLKVDLDATNDEQGRLVATVITVDGDDLETAEMIQAGLHPTAQQVAANTEGIEANKKGIAVNSADINAHEQKIQQNMQDIQENSQRFEKLDDYSVKGQTSLNFDTGSSTLSSKDQDDLKQLASQAKAIDGYLIEVNGYADSSGSAAMNTKLSEDRAKSAVTFLVQQCGIPARRIVAPGAMGEYGAVASNETSAGRAENRRVDVKVLVNKAVAGS